MNNDLATPLCVDQQEAAEMLRVSVRHFRKIVKAGLVPKIYLGRQIPRYRIVDLEAYLESRVEALAVPVAANV